jgi:hypothetical protein
VGEERVLSTDLGNEVVVDEGEVGEIGVGEEGAV